MEKKLAYLVPGLAWIALFASFFLPPTSGLAIRIVLAWTFIMSGLLSLLVFLWYMFFEWDSSLVNIAVASFIGLPGITAGLIFLYSIFIWTQGGMT